MVLVQTPNLNGDPTIYQEVRRDISVRLVHHVGVATVSEKLCYESFRGIH
jgi:hypothetical protein